MLFRFKSSEEREAERIMKMINRATDPKELIYIVQNAPTESLASSALRRIDKWWDLAQVMNSPVSGSLKQQALRQIRQESQFVDLLLCGHLNDPEVESAVLEKVGDEEKIYSYMVSHSNLAPAAVRYLKNEEYLCHIVTDSRSARRVYSNDARKAALGKIKGQDCLSKVVHMGILGSSDGSGASDRAFIAEAAGRLTREEDILWVLNWYRDYTDICKAVLNGITDTGMLKKIAESSKGNAKMLAEEKLGGRAALDKVFGDKAADIQARFRAAAALKLNYGDNGPLSELEKLGEETVNGHILYTTVNLQWEQTEKICLRCGKTGGVEHDSESTRHYGCDFRAEPCRGIDPKDI